ncbi:MAG TPA: hypothetical protein VH331_04355 [Allosphingosinicella sp.]|jgi:hypothetical protein|nr:hypothetical protein [Allosphingosinicella sp.]
MASAAPMIAAAAASARRRVLGAFREADATSPERAIGFQPQRRMEERYFDALVDCGGIVGTDKGTFWMDEAKVAQHTARRRKRAAMIFGGVLAATAALLGLTQV